MESLFNVDNVVDWLSHFGIWAIIISVLLNIFISIIGILPSVFLSSANAILFGLPLGFAISLCEETIGAFVTYIAAEVWVGEGLYKLALRLF